MPEAGWAIRFLEGNNYEPKGTIDFASNYGEDARLLDKVIAFSGFYGIDDYLVWYIHKNIPSYDFSTVVLNLRLTMYKNIEAVYFQDFYRVQDVKYDSNRSQFVLYAISEGSLRLHKKLINFKVKSLSYKENRKAVDVIRDVIQDNNIFYVKFHEDTESTKNLPHYEYRYFDFDIEWTVLDFIQYICNDNMYEWCIDKFIGEDSVPHYVLHIGHELKPYKYRNATKEYEPELDNIATTIYGFKISTVPSPINILSHWEETHKCVWARHSAGKGGGTSKGYFTKIGQGHFNTRLYLNSLEGDIEKDIGFSRLKKEKKRLSSVTLGNIIKDEGVVEGQMSPYIDEVSLQRNPHTYTVREPHKIIINKGDDLVVQHQLERASRSTPYLDYEAGLLFPSPKFRDEVDGFPIPQESPPNSLVFNVDGKRESSVVGGYVYGNGREDYPIPIKNRDDFRLKFPDKAELFYNSLEGFWALESKHGFAFKNSAVTDYDMTPAQRLVAGDSTAVILKDDMFWIEGPTQLFQLEPGGCFHIFPKTDENGNPGEGRYQIHAWNDIGEIDLYADNEINIKISKVNGEIDIAIGPNGTYAGTININCGGTVNIGANATAVNIAGGANELAHKTHSHIGSPAVDGLFKLPLIGSVANNTTGTTKTKGD